MSPGKPAEAAGLRAGDRIVSVGGKPVADFSEVFPIVSVSAGRNLAIV